MSAPPFPAFAPDRTLAAAAAILGYGLMVTGADSFVRVIAAEAGLWQFQALRTAMAIAILAVAAPLFGLRLWPRRPGPALARSAVHAAAMLCYFGSLGVLPVAQAVAGLFTAPIFVLLITRFAYGRPLGPARIGAVAAGFAGVVLVLGPGAAAPAGWIAILPLAAGALYALASVALREWCPGESAESLTLLYILTIGAAGLAGMLVLWALPQPVPAGGDGFLLRGPVWFSAAALWWTFVQAVAAVAGVMLMVRAYQIAEASRVAVFEYVLLPLSIGWGWLIWGQTVTPVAAAGMALIAAAGIAIALRGQAGAAP
jgi:drug/metabolite transporter (DMT)-like permease